MNTRTPDVVVIGGGLIGLLSALLLRRRGKSVEVLERGQCGQESSWAGGGILSPLYPWRYSDAVNQLAKWSQQHYPAFTRELFDISGLDPEWTHSGLIILDQDEFENGLQWAQGYGTSASVERVSALEVHLSESLNQGLYFPDIAQVRNPRLLASLKATAEIEGVVIREQTEVTDLIEENGRVTAVATGNGQVSADSFVVAGGAWSAQILSRLECLPEIKPVKGQMLLFKGEPGTLRHMVMDKGRYLIPRRDGHILVGSTLEDSGFDCQTTGEAKQELMADALRLMPMLEEVDQVAHWAGLRPGSPDGVPYIGAHPQLANLYLNSGHFRNGVVLGLASARVLTDILCGEQSVVELNAYNLSRNSL